MADAILSGANLNATKQDVITAIVQKELKFQAKLMPYVTDVSQFAVKGAKTIAFPKMTSFTVTNRSFGAAGDATTLTAANDTLLLDKNAYVAWLVDESDAVQSTIEWTTETLKRAATAHARYMDQQILAELELGAGFDSGAGVTITRDIILAMRKFVTKNAGGLDAGQFVLAVGYDQEEALLKISEFTSAEVYGSSNVPTGVIGRVYGIPVMIHSALEGKAIMWEKSALAVGLQKAPNYSEQGANEYGSQSKRKVLDQLFGVKSLQIDQGEQAPIATKSGLIAKM